MGGVIALLRLGCPECGIPLEPLVSTLQQFESIDEAAGSGACLHPECIEPWTLKALGQGRERAQVFMYDADGPAGPLSR